jgi:hypothetical protein
MGRLVPTRALSDACIGGSHLDFARKILISIAGTQQEKSKWALIPLGLSLTLLKNA